MTDREKKIPNILVTEGLWGAGKTTIIADIRQSFPVLFIPEPNYQTAGIRSGISEWYQSQHKKRLGLAQKYTEYGEHVIMERSILSSAAFYYAQYGQYPKWFAAIQTKLRSIANFHVLFLYYEKDAFLQKVSEIKDASVRSAIRKNKYFYENYVRFYKELRLDCVCIKIPRNHQHPPSLIKSIQKIVGIRTQKRLTEVGHVCANAVILYKDKFLLLYSPRHKQFTFPQGHQKTNEKLPQTVSREINEETGFTDFEVLDKIRTYNFRFYDNGFIIRKKITCYLVRLRTLSKDAKKFEAHESYKNYFFTPAQALKKLRWPEDKKTIDYAQHIMNKV